MKLSVNNLIVPSFLPGFKLFTHCLISSTVIPDTKHFYFMSLAFSSFKLSISSISNDTQLYNSENLSEKTLAMLSSVSALSILFGLLLLLPLTLLISDQNFLEFSALIFSANVGYVYYVHLI